MPFNTKEKYQVWYQKYKKEKPKAWVNWYQKTKKNNPELYQDILRRMRIKTKRQWKEKRDVVLEIFGNQCYYCQDTKRLNLHHLWYELDSPRGSHGSDGRKRIKEAIEHPERFRAVCYLCHQVITLLNSKYNYKLISVLQKEKIID